MVARNIHWLWKKTRRDRGLTLLELVVVSGVLAILSAIVATSVTGRGTETRGTTQAADVATVQAAVASFTGSHPQGRYPTLNGCLADFVLDLVSLTCITRSQAAGRAQIDDNNLEFVFNETSSELDLNNDGDIEDQFLVVPIIWHKAFESDGFLSQGTEIKRYFPDFLNSPPKHAFDFLRGLDESWEDGVNLDPDDLQEGADPSRITAPEGVGPGDNWIDVDNDQVPVWVLGKFETNKNVQVTSLLPDSLY